MMQLTEEIDEEENNQAKALNSTVICTFCQGTEKTRKHIFGSRFYTGNPSKLFSKGVVFRVANGLEEIAYSNYKNVTLRAEIFMCCECIPCGFKTQ